VKLERVIETCLYVDNLDRAANFYEQVLAIEGRTDWSRGGHSIYFRDPDGHLLELATPGLWAIY